MPTEVAVFLQDPTWLLALPVALGWAAYWYRRRATGHGASRTALVLWTLVVILVALAASGPRIPEERPVPADVVVLVDGSESMRGLALERAREYAAKVVAAAPPGAVVRIGTFGRGLAFDDAGFDPTGTAIARAIALAAALPSQGGARRVVVVSDMNETEGDAQSAARAARAANVVVHVKTITETAPELLVSALEVPRIVRRTQPFSAVARVDGTRPGKVTCSLRLQGGPEITRSSDFRPPTGAVKFEGLTVPRDSIDRVEVRVECHGAEPLSSGWPQNDSWTEVVEIAGKTRVWCVDEGGSQCATLSRVLGDAGDVVTTTVSDLARLPVQSPRPDVVVIGDTEPKELLAFAEPLTEAVKAGTGLLFLGGEKALSQAGLGGTAIERDLLPVFLNRKQGDEPERAVLMVIDRSSSMAGQKIALAREAAIGSASALPKDTLLGVMAFDTKVWDILPLAPVADGQRAAQAIASITVGGGTDIFKALQAARDAMESVRASQRLVVLLTDGASNPKGVVETAQAMGRMGVQVSTIAIGPEPDRVLLARVAEATGGRHYWARDAEAVPRLLLDEVTGGQSGPTREGKRAVVPAPTPVARKVFRGVDPARLAPVEGLSQTEERPEGVLIATAESGEPVAAIRQVGAGEVAVFTPGLSEAWTKAFMEVPEGKRFVANLMSVMQKQAGSVEVRPGLRPGEDRIEITADVLGPDGSGLEGAQVNATVFGPDGTTRQVRLEPVALGRHAASIVNDFGVLGSVASRSGTYRLVLSGKGPGPDRLPLPEVQTYASLPFPAELARFQANMTLAAQVAEAGGGKVDPTPEEVFAGTGTLPFARPISHLFLLPAIVLFVVGLFARKRTGRGV